MTRTKKRRKSSRYHGSQTAHRGAKERTRGSGNRGGYGMAGSGKRGDAKKTLVIKLFGNNYFGKDKTLRRGTQAPKLQAINVQDIEDRMESFVAEKLAKAAKEGYEVNLAGYKILGEGDVTIKMHITASAASASAAEKIQKAGGSIILANEDKDEKPVLKKEVAKEIKPINKK